MTGIASPLEMTDDEVTNTSFTAFEESVEPSIEKVEPVHQDTPEEPSEEELEPSAEGEEEEEREEGEREEEKEEEKEEEPEQSPRSSGERTEKKIAPDHTGSIDYKSEYEKLLRPFKASNRTVTVKSVDEAISLMQRGVDYVNKLHELKPNLKLLKALEKNGINTEEKINFYIDLEKGNPDAIAQLLKNKKIDPLDVNTSEETVYTPKSYAPSDQEMALDDVLDHIKGTTQYERTVAELGNKWDLESKKVFMEQPQLISIINDHIGSGIYDKIMQVVDNERLFGRLEGVSDLAAYKRIGDALQAQGAFNTPVADESKPESKSERDQAVREKKKAAATPRRLSPVSSGKDLHPLSMSDDEIEKISISGFATA